MEGGLVGSSERPKRWLSKLAKLVAAAEEEIKGGEHRPDQLPPVLFPALSI